MDQRHLLEEDQQSRALKEFTNLQSMKDLVDWTLFTPILVEVFGPPRTRDCESIQINPLLSNIFAVFIA